VRYLLDSGPLLQALFNHADLPARIALLLSDPANEFFVSAVSPYELELKKSIGKLPFPDVPDWPAVLGNNFFLSLPVETRHGVLAARLPLHHRDPWDRLLIAQALAEGLVVVTSDRLFAAYGVPTVW
jgi:PIN domain nuclease of toxin-antitoxin system